MKIIMLMLTGLLAIPALARARDAGTTNQPLWTGAVLRTQERLSYEDAQRERMARLDAWWIELKARGAEMGDEVQDDWREFMQGSEATWKETKQKASDGREAGNDKWEALKDDVERGMDDFEDSLKQARSKWFPTRDEFVIHTRAKLDAMKEELIVVRQRADRAGSGATDAARKEIEALEASLKETAEHLQDSVSASDDEWKHVRGDLSHTVRRLEERIKDLAKQFPDGKDDRERILDTVS